MFLLRLFMVLKIFTSKASTDTSVNHFVKEMSVLSIPHQIINNTDRLIVCADYCSSIYDCCGLTMDKSTMNCLLFYYQTSNNCQHIPNGGTNVQFIKQLTDCSELPPEKPSGVYRVYPSRQTAVLVYCEMTDAGGGWTVLQRRQDGSENFYRSWDDYKTGFGDSENEFWIGNEIIHDITSQKQYKVRFDLEDFDGVTAYAEYEKFFVDQEFTNYSMDLSGYSGNAGDAMDYALIGGIPFSARSVDNDQWFKSCADECKKEWLVVQKLLLCKHQWDVSAWCFSPVYHPLENMERSVVYKENKDDDQTGLERQLVNE